MSITFYVGGAMAGIKILGLDLGTSSVGWSLIELDEDNGTGNLNSIGSRIFEPPVEEKSGEPKNVKRRTARGQRRLLV
jgi:CRISPR-associated endonuclease Csn1